MTRAKFLVSLVLGAVVVSTGPSANAGTQIIDDPDRDGQIGAALDITEVRVANNDRAIVTSIAFREVTGGDLALYYRPAGSARRDVVLVYSRHRARRDRNELRTVDGEQECAGLSVTWDRDADTARVRLPASCFHDGSYGDIRVRLITEIGGDADLAPSTPRGGWPWSAPIPRG
ncbi:hypothetical protein [Nocardioides sp. 1609]|uniref:hypothetical protein n=1 Tax=Nocardioides sp. 1609 TaxID=2508327 RepID=UPI00107034AC|nr:hypothetical protein [Nocardioides sp. 1609]